MRVSSPERSSAAPGLDPGAAACAPEAVEHVASPPAGRAGDGAFELTTAIARGDADAFSRFYSAWFDRSFVAVRRATGGDEAFCLDVVQDAMMKAIRAITPMPNEAVLGTWFMRVVMNAAKDRIKGEARRRARERRYASQRREGAAFEGREFGPEAVERVAAEIEKLDATLGMLVGSRYAFGMTLARAGAAFGLTPASTDRRLARALRTLRDRMGDGEP